MLEKKKRYLTTRHTHTGTVRISLCLVACLCVLITETRVQWTSRIFWMDSDLVLHLHEKLYRKSSENTSGTTLSYGENHTGDVSASASRLVDIKCENDSYARTWSTFASVERFVRKSKPKTHAQVPHSRLINFIVVASIYMFISYVMYQRENVKRYFHSHYHSLPQ